MTLCRAFALFVIAAAVLVVGYVDRGVIEDAAQAELLPMDLECLHLVRGQWLRGAIMHCPDRALCTHDCWHGYSTAQRFAL